MLELKIEELVTAVRELSGKLDMLTCTIAQVTSSVSPRSSDNPAPAPAPAPAPVQQVTEHELTALCLEIVRADRSKKDEVKGVIASFGGELISDIPKDRYPELATKLEALK
jgi:hypothetical protein